MVSVQHVEDDGRRAHLGSDAKAPLHRINDKRSSKAFALHVLADGHRANVDDRNVRKGRTRRWVKRAGGMCRSGVSYVRAVAGRLSAAESGGEHYAANAATVRDYLLKGAHPDAQQALRLTRKGEGGPVIGNWAIWNALRWAAGKTTGPRIHTFHSDDGSVPCSASAG